MKKILIFVHDLYEDLELWYPKIRVEEENIQTVVAGPVSQKSYMGKHGYPCKTDQSFEEIDPQDFAGLIIPGGFAPDKLRRDKKVLKITQEIFKDNKLIAFICHGGWVPISAKIVKGKKVTSVSAIKDDLENAGAIWSDEAVVQDQNLLSSRTPKDLPLFGLAIVSWLKK